MPQAGIHGMVGMATRRWTGARDWLLLGAILGSFVPDMDTVAVAVATVMKASSEGLHRTMTHSVFFAAAVMIVFHAIGAMRRDTRWTNLGLGLGLGILLHIVLDLFLWFNGVNLFWPLGGEVTLWPNGYPWAWFQQFNEQAAEFLCFGLYLWLLGTWARKFGTNGNYLGKLRMWIWLEFALFAVFATALLLGKVFVTISGALYLFSLLMTFFVTIRMRQTVEAARP